MEKEGVPLGVLEAEATLLHRWGYQLTVDIVALALVMVLEIVVHLSFALDFSIPLWAWLMIICPAAGAGVMSCFNGFSVYCDVILGAVGINLLESPSIMHGPKPEWGDSRNALLM